MTNLQQYKLILFFGFALFAMFFGSGNLVFPLQIGSVSYEHWFISFLGLLFTGILLPFLGLFVIKLHKGNYSDFFGEAGKIAKIVLPLITLSLLGSFGVVPRCITVAYGGTNYALPNVTLLLFSGVFCICAFLCGLRENVMLKLLGKWMSPVLIGLLLLLIFLGVISDDVSVVSVNNIISKSKPEESFINGFLTGYQTMDLFAAFFFSSLVFKQVEEKLKIKKNDKEILIFAVKSSFIGCVLIATIYVGFVFLGAKYHAILQNISPENMLPTIAKNVMGEAAAWFIAMAMIFSCFTTAIALNGIYAKYLHKTLKLNEKSFPVTLFITTLISFVISLLDFRGITMFLGPVLGVLYPGIIILTCLTILTKGKYAKAKSFIFWGITLIMIFI